METILKLNKHEVRLLLALGVGDGEYYGDENNDFAKACLAADSLVRKGLISQYTYHRSFDLFYAPGGSISATIELEGYEIIWIIKFLARSLGSLLY